MSSKRGRRRVRAGSPILAATPRARQAKLHKLARQIQRAVEVKPEPPSLPRSSGAGRRARPGETPAQQLPEKSSRARRATDAAPAPPPPPAAPATPDAPGLRITIPLPAGGAGSGALLSPRDQPGRARVKAKRARAHGLNAATATAQPAPREPACVFPGYAFTPDAPPETIYDFARVPLCKPDLSESVLLRPASRRQWFACLKELESLAQESLERRATRLGLLRPSGLPLVYIADRMDIDDPLWGYQVRSAATGWLQGFITLTVFTTWTHFFQWDSLSERSGMAAARVANALAGRPDPAVHQLTADETVAQLAARMGVRAAGIIAWNAHRLAQLTPTTRLPAGIAVYVRDPAATDTVHVRRKGGETVSALAARIGVSVDDLLRLNAQRHPQILPTTKLAQGTVLLYRDRSAEPDVFLPTGAAHRQLDEDGSLAAELQTQERYGDPTTTGVVWPRVVEIGLLAGLGCGKALVRLALEELAASRQFDFAVLQATMASVSFYEEMGFVRVGAVARYASNGTPLASLPLQGYRHWASADEASPEQFGDISYMMALRLSSVRLKGKARPSRALAERLATAWPEVQSAAPPRSSAKSHRKAPAGNCAGIEGGSAIKVGDLALNMDDGEDARLQLCMEVDRVLEAKVGPDGVELLRVKWRHCAEKDATWECATADAMQSAAAKAALAKFRKAQRKEQPAEDGRVAARGGSGGRGRGRSLGRSAENETVAPGRWWMGRVVRSLGGQDTMSPSRGRIFRGGLGEPCSSSPEAVTPAAELADGDVALPLEREHRFWYIADFHEKSKRCLLRPLLAAGRFGGCGRRAGRVRWRPAEVGKGLEREAAADTLQLVHADSVTGAREPLGEAFAIDEPDVEQAAREQAAAARNKRRSTNVIESAVITSAVEPLPLAAAEPERRSRGRVAPAATSAAQASMPQTLAPESEAHARAAPAAGRGAGRGRGRSRGRGRGSSRGHGAADAGRSAVVHSLPAPVPADTSPQGNGGLAAGRRRRREAAAGSPCAVGASENGGQRVRKRICREPEPSACLACSKGKHSAHTCGTRGKALGGKGGGG
mmetsp:Transcript_27335/g.83096  ORF Transcript_27335/g.83096 Transcript_27335/m.83096 type:complete len:1063 (-) Transcript_27335:1086-4274(-)